MDTDQAVEHVPTTASLAPLRGGAIVSPAVQAAQALEAQEAYQELCRQLLDSHDVQRIGDRDFRKKSGWRKLAVAFNVSNEIVSREYERDDRGRIIRAEVIDRATAPNGRTCDGLGACDLFEKCCAKKTCRIKVQWHDHCDEITGGCDGTRHFSNPQHDIPATAATRARNRSCADLFGMGEVSAEEITNPGGDNHGGGRTRSGEEDDQRTWFEQNGWEDEAEHNRRKEALVESLRSLPDDAKKAFGAWRREEAKIELGREANTLAEVETMESKVAALTDAPEPAQDAPGAIAGPEGGESPAAGQETPQEDAEGEASERVEGIHRAQQITEHVKAMKLQDVDNALSDNEQPADGPANERRKRLAVFLVEHPDIDLPA